MNLADMDNEAFQKLLRDKVAGGISGKGSKQRIVSVDEIEKYLSKGFEFKSVLPNGRAIMKMPFLKI
jgi:hypothetical protein